MTILNVLEQKEPLRTEKYLAESPNVQLEIRTCIDAGKTDELLEQSQHFKALGMRYVVQSALSGLNLLDRHIKKAS